MADYNPGDRDHEFMEFNHDGAPMPPAAKKSSMRIDNPTILSQLAQVRSSISPVISNKVFLSNRTIING